MSTSLPSPSDALRAARVMWAEHTRGLYDPPLDSEHVALLERILGEEGMRRAIEEDPVLSSDEWQALYAAVTLWSVNASGLLNPPLAPADVAFLRDYIAAHSAEYSMASASSSASSSPASSPLPTPQQSPTPPSPPTKDPKRQYYEDENILSYPTSVQIARDGSWREQDDLPVSKRIRLQ